ncbi:MAG: metallopeptidase TldD-related protein, partial [Candidatus Phytoplasma stylosanthis]|nr:metallopeptidase TldD-related protein [Candidatus Phytoplasma stylosanthis]
EKALKKGFTALEILTNEKKTMTLNLEDGKINENIQSDLLEVVIKGLYKNKKSSLYLEKIEESKIDEVLESLKVQISVLNSKEKDIIFKGSKSYPVIPEYNFNFSSVELEKKNNLLFQFEKELLNKSSFLKKIDFISYSEVFLKEKIVNSEGLELEQKNSFASLSVECVFKKNEVIETISDNFPVKKINEFNISEYAKKIINLGEKKMDSCSIESKNYPTVFSNKIFAKLLQSFSSIFSGISVYRNLTKLKNKKNQQIASSQVTIIDDPLNKNAFFQYKFDDEGVACQKKTIIEEGILKQFIHNLKTSLIFKVEPTGNFFNDSISMSNCYLKEGKKSLEEIISSIKEGVYIDFLMGLHAGINTISGDFSLQAGGFKIEKGKITYPIKMIIVSGNFFELLLDIKEISNDLFFKTSGFGSPSVYIENLTIAGQN